MYFDFVPVHFFYWNNIIMSHIPCSYITVVITGQNTWIECLNTVLLTLFLLCESYESISWEFGNFWENLRIEWWVFWKKHCEPVPTGTWMLCGIHGQVVWVCGNSCGQCATVLAQPGAHIVILLYGSCLAPVVLSYTVHLLFHNQIIGLKNLFTPAHSLSDFQDVWVFECLVHSVWLQ